MAVDVPRDLGRPGPLPRTYWSRVPGRYFAGDGAKRDAEGYFWLLGRVDDIMLVAGHNISTTEVESSLVSHPSVAEAAVVGKTDDTTGQAVAAFVILRAGNGPSDTLVAELHDHVAHHIGPIRKPKSILFTEDLPKTRSGKIMRRLLRNVAEDQALGDTTTLADPGGGRRHQRALSGHRDRRGLSLGPSGYVPEHWTCATAPSSRVRRC